MKGKIITDRIVELIREYADCQDELDVFKVAAEIREIVITEYQEALELTIATRNLTKY